MGELNLLPYSLKEKKQKVFKTRQYAAAALILICILFLGIYLPKIYLADLKKQEISLQAEINANKIILEQSKITNEELANYKNRIELINVINQSRVTASDRIEELQQYVPKDSGFTFNNLVYNKNGFTISGTTSNYNYVSEFVANLQMANKYKSAKITSISGNGKHSYNFNITITYYI
jgi:Tfp pilus assembly protein PilN